MKTTIKTLTRTYFVVLGLLFLWAIWAAAQEVTNIGTNTGTGPAQLTNSPPARTEAVTTSPSPATGTGLSFGLDRISALDQTRPFGEPLWRYLASLIYLVLALLSARLLDWLISDRLKSWAAKTDTEIDDLLLGIIHGPIKVIAFVLLLHVGLRLFEWPAWVSDYLSRILKIVVAWSLTYMALKGVDLLVTYWRRRVTTVEDKAFDDQLFQIVRKTVKVFIVIIAILLTSQNLGLNITSVLASLSIGGMALGFAAQDTISNLFGAIAIFMDKPFRIGDRIRVDSVDGVVETIGLRSTRIRNLDGHLITVPNKTMQGATITNVTKRPTIKTEMNFGLTYDTPPEKVRRAIAILDDVFRSHQMTHDVLISFNKFDTSSLNIYVAHWWKGGDQVAYMAGLQTMNFAILQRFNAERIEMAFPTQTLCLKQDSDWKVVTGPATPGRF